jgi:hypothetical protein
MSSLSWIDFSEQERKQALEIIDQLNEPEARDELGIGSVRDAIANLLFPGTSTIQTRAKYFLFVPWIYIELERQKVKSSEVARRARRMETQLIEELLQAGETDGTIGRNARSGLKRLPSNIYWQGLGLWGIRLFPGSQEPYHRSLDTYYQKRNDGRHRNKEEEQIIEVLQPNWHQGIPKAPSSFPRQANFSLTFEEAQYLRERVYQIRPFNLLAHLLRRNEFFEEVKFPWELPFLSELDTQVKTPLIHGKYFSYTLNGASLLYNLLLAEKAGYQDWIERYDTRLAEWWEDIKKLGEPLIEWNRKEFWEIVKSSEDTNIHPRTEDFINEWLDFVIENIKEKALTPNWTSLKKVCTLIENRESNLKKSKSRFKNPQALRLWNGESGTAQLAFRWDTAQTIIHDILTGIGRGE